MIMRAALEAIAPMLGQPSALDPIVESVRAKLLARSQAGLAKYGVGLNRTDLTNLQWLQHLQDELLDAANYAERLMLGQGKDAWGGGIPEGATVQIMTPAMPESEVIGYLRKHIETLSLEIARLRHPDHFLHQRQSPEATK